MDNLAARVAVEIRRDAETRGLSVNRLAQLSGLSRVTLTRRLAGSPLTVDELESLAETLGTLPSRWLKRAESAK